MYILIDSPVYPGSPPEEIQEWILELEKLAEEHKDDPEAMLAITPNLERARRWLAEGESEQK